MKTSAMIFAAGLGTRLYPLTENKPKALVEYKGMTLLERAIRKVTEFGIRQIVINVHHFGEQILDFVENHSFDADIIISDERENLLDTAGGLKWAEAHFANSEQILLYNVDIISNINLQKLIETHQRSEAMVTLAVRNRETARYFIFDKNTMQLCGWTNIQTGEKKEVFTIENSELLAFSGIHCVNKSILNKIPVGEKCSFTPLYLQLANSEKILGYLHQEDDWMDVGKVEYYR